MYKLTDVLPRRTCDVFSFSIAYREPGLKISAVDLGYELDGDDLSDFIPVLLPFGVEKTEIPQVDADDFESVFFWFIA